MKKYRTDGGVAVAAAPVFNNDVDLPIQSDSGIVRPGRPSPGVVVIEQDAEPQLQRPVVVRAPGVVRPIPRRAAEEFYEAAQGLTYAQVHQAIMESHEWHRLYTSNHPDPTTLSSTNVPEDVIVVPDSIIADREMGAKNPSPAIGDERKRRLRLSGSISDVSSRDDEDDKGNSPAVETAAEKQQPMIVLKPIAMRVPRPKALMPANTTSTTTSATVPSDISIAERSLSPLTLCSQATGTAEATKPPAMMIEDEEEDNNCYVFCPASNPETPIWSAVHEARDGILHAMAVTGGDTDSPQFTECLQILSQHYEGLGISTKNDDARSEGMWLTLTKPTFFGNLGDNDQGDPMYTLGRMSFDMFSPGDLVCSLQGNFNSVQEIEPTEALLIPKSLRDEVSAGSSVLRTYNVVTAFTIEPPSAAYPKSPNMDVTRPIRGIMTTYGYMIADPATPNRHSVWITGGRINPNDSRQDQAAWKRLFALHPPKYGVGAQARLLAVKLLMGAVLPESMDPETGAMEYTFTRPIGGHGLAYIDTLFVDDSLRIVRGHRGTLFVFSRMPDHTKK